MSQSPQPPRVTVNDVAVRASVSRQTVSNVLTHPARVRPDTRDRVMAAIADLDYEPSSSAQSLRSRRTGAIGVEMNTLGPRSHNETMAPFLASLGMQAAELHAHVVPFGSALNVPMIEGYRRMWARRLVDAFVIADTHHGDPRPEWLESRGVPFAAFGRVWDDPGFTAWVDVDGASGTRQAVRHLVAGGYRTIGYLGWPRGSVVGDDRSSGWQTECDAAGAGRRGPSEVASQDLDSARGAARRLLDQLGPGDAVVCASDVLALGVHHELLVDGRRLGADLGVMGFDDSEAARMHRLSSVAQPVDVIARRLLGLLENASLGRPPPASGLLLEPTLAVRTSTTKVPAPSP